MYCRSLIKFSFNAPNKNKIKAPNMKLKEALAQLNQSLSTNTNILQNTNLLISLLPLPQLKPSTLFQLLLSFYERSNSLVLLDNLKKLQKSANEIDFLKYKIIVDEWDDECEVRLCKYDSCVVDKIRRFVRSELVKSVCKAMRNVVIVENEVVVDEKCGLFDVDCFERIGVWNDFKWFDENIRKCNFKAKNYVLTGFKESKLVAENINFSFLREFDDGADENIILKDRMQNEKYKEETDLRREIKTEESYIIQFIKAVSCAKAGKFSKAIEYLKRLVNTKYKNINTHILNLLSYCYYMVGNLVGFVYCVYNCRIRHKIVNSNYDLILPLFYGEVNLYLYDEKNVKHNNKSSDVVQEEVDSKDKVIVGFRKISKEYCKCIKGTDISKRKDGIKAFNGISDNRTNGSDINVVGINGNRNNELGADFVGINDNTNNESDIDYDKTKNNNKNIELGAGFVGVKASNRTNDNGLDADYDKTINDNKHKKIRKGELQIDFNGKNCFCSQSNNFEFITKQIKCVDKNDGSLFIDCQFFSCNQNLFINTEKTINFLVMTENKRLLYYVVRNRTDIYRELIYEDIPIDSKCDTKQFLQKIVDDSKINVVSIYLSKESLRMKNYKTDEEIEIKDFFKKIEEFRKIMTEMKIGLKITDKVEWWNTRIKLDTKLKNLLEMKINFKVDGVTALLVQPEIAKFPFDNLSVFRGTKIFRICKITDLLKFEITSNVKSRGKKDIPIIEFAAKDPVYVLDPTNTLKKTQNRILPLLKGYKGVVGQLPTQSFLNNIKNSLLYFGHGNGAKYNLVADVMGLFGCSSLMGIYKEGFDYKIRVKAISIGCLWDVTDFDLDEIAKVVLKTERVDFNVCRLKYLNGCAIVVYGV